MSQRANGILGWMLLSMLILVANDLSPLVLAEGPNNIVNYPIQNYLYWSTAGEIPWTIDYTSGYNDKISLKSEPIECAGESDLRMNNISGPAIIQFKWMMDVGPGIGQLIFSVDGKNIIECSSRDWTDFSYPLNADRSHTLEWTFRKIKSYPLWKGAGWIDDINLVRMDSQGNGEYVDRVVNGGNNASDAAKWSMDNGVQIPKFISNNATGNQTKPGVNIIIEKVIYYQPNPCAIKGNVTIKPISPRDNEILSEDGTMKFEFKPSDQKMVTNCTLLIDGKERAYSRNIRTNESNELTPDRKLDEEGIYRWNAICCECGVRCNTTKDVYFKIYKNNNTTYVNQKNPDETHFVYPTIGQAINKTDKFGRVIIEGGTYGETITIDKSLTIIGLNKPTLHPALNSRDRKGIITILQNDVEISGLVIKNSDYGIHIAGKNGNGGLKNITIKGNEISECGSEIFAEYCNDGNISNNIIGYSNKPNFYRTGIQLEYCNNLTIDFNEFNEASRQPKGSAKMQYCINMLSCDNKTVMQIRHNIFEYSDYGVYIRQNHNSTTEIKLYLKGNNRFNISDSRIVNEGT